MTGARSEPTSIAARTYPRGGRRGVAHAAVAHAAVARAAVAAGMFLLLVGLGGCRTAPPVDPAGLTPAAIFQRAQDASDAGDYGRALAWYEAFQARYPNDPERGPWAMYEIAFLHHKMGDDATAVKLFDELIDFYQSHAEGLPPAPLVLAKEVKARIQESRSP